MRFIPNNDAVQKAMLEEMGLSGLEELLAGIPTGARLARELRLPPGMSEEEQLALFESLAGKNRAGDFSSFLGGGAYHHFIPLTADSLIQRGEFLTAYTPYQPEVSQGTLQAIFEFQSFMTYLTGTDVANASVYDGASATAEAVLMAVRIQRGRRKVIVAASLHPYYRRVLETYIGNLELEVVEAPVEQSTGRLGSADLEELLDEQTVCLVLQQPNFFGVIEELKPLAAQASRAGALLVTTVTEALSLALLEPPGACGADIVVGEAQSFGVPLYHGGPYLGFMACKDSYKRQLPGRISGQTVDEEGRRGFVLTLATREQHIRREKATSNICTNQNLVMLSALIHLTLMGREGLRRAALQNVSLLAYFNGQLAGLPGYRKRFSGANFNEVALTCPRPAGEVVAACLERGIIPGLDLGRFQSDWSNELLIAITETKDKAAIDALVKALREAA